MNFRITILCENSVGPLSGTLGEHGFSALIEPTEGEPILFDTGQGATLLHNARRMNKDLSLVRKVVISHGHYDHTGGLRPLLQECGRKTAYGHHGIFAARYRVKDTGEHLAIGMQYDRTSLENEGATFDLSDEFRQIAPNVFLTGQVPRTIEFEAGDRGLFCDCNGQEADNTPDDQSLVLATEKGLAVILGCCHAGLVNTIEHIAVRTGRRDVYAVIGGTHLGFCDNKQLDLTIAAIRGMGLKKIAGAHCTGFSASSRMSQELPKEFQIAMVGYTLEI